MESPDLSSSGWDARYRTTNIPWDMGQVSPPLVAFHRLGLLPSGPRVFVPGCGTGYEVAFLAQVGFEAVGADFAPHAIEAACRLLAGSPKARAVCVDVLQDDNGLLDPPFDWAFDQTFFCAIEPPLRGRYAAAMRRVIRIGGEIWALSFRVPGMGGPPFDSTPDELIDLLRAADFTLLERRELCDESHPARRGRETLVRMRRQ